MYRSLSLSLALSFSLPLLLSDIICDSCSVYPSTFHSPGSVLANVAWFSPPSCTSLYISCFAQAVVSQSCCFCLWLCFSARLSLCFLPVFPLCLSPPVSRCLSLHLPLPLRLQIFMERFSHMLDIDL